MSAPAPTPPALSAPVPLPPSPAAGGDTPLSPAAGDEKRSSAARDKTPHMALLLPLGSSAFGRHADAVNDGFLAAAKVHGDAALPVRAYATGDDPEQAVRTYLEAVNAGARIVVGPLTRDGVTAVAGSAAVLVPTLALNVPQIPLDAAAEIYVLSLQAEAEARQVAQLAFQDGFRKAITVNGDTPLLKRIHQAFVEEFTRLGGAHVIAYDFTTDTEYLSRIRKVAGSGSVDMGFLALDFTRARLARPYLGALPAYATSQVHPGNTGLLAGFDLAGVRFLDMPWLLQPDHPAVMIYPRPRARDDIELDRFYALGIDAFRIAQALLAGRADATLDGVTGRLTLDRGHQFARRLTVAQFADGKLTVVRERP